VTTSLAAEWEDFTVAIPSAAETNEKKSGLPPIEDVFAFIDEKIELPPDIIEGVLHSGGKAALGGGSKTFKTWQQLDVLASVSTGTPWLEFNTRQGRVLYINLELEARFCRKRIQDIFRAKSVRPLPEQFHVWNLRGFAMDVDALIPQILTHIEACAGTQYALIDLDPIYKLFGQYRDENKTGDIARMCNALESLAVQSGAAVLFGHHYSKGNQSAKDPIDRTSGSGVFGRDPDTILNFTRHEEDDAYTVDPILRNHPQLAPFVVRWEYPLMVRDDNLDPRRLKQTGGAPRKATHGQLLDLLAQPLTAKAWKELAKKELGISERTFYRMKGELDNDGRVESTAGEWLRK
jgi:hypothetical protein